MPTPGDLLFVLKSQDGATLTAYGDWPTRGNVGEMLVTYRRRTMTLKWLRKTSVEDAEAYLRRLMVRVDAEVLAGLQAPKQAALEGAKP